ncbi:MAG: hypothetical protein A2Y86_05335 [Candidatus Aminicenantes bacterium RBG_13_62_12]|nr:MAG: hypothetical protein A2Y86_05335 [Candidatus Aminicenantes bacterium RBG_13_62_12]
MAIGWLLDLASAESYFEDERLETAAWDALFAMDTTGLYAEKALLNAFNRLYYDRKYILPTYAEASAAQLVKLRKAQCEMAYYLAQHLADEDRRKGIQAQGVVKSGVVQEDYDPKWLDRIPVPPFVDALLSEFKGGGPLHIANVERDEDESADEKVHEF